MWAPELFWTFSRMGTHFTPSGLRSPDRPELRRPGYIIIIITTTTKTNKNNNNI
jgi:hypothetical protein